MSFATVPNWFAKPELVWFEQLIQWPNPKRIIVLAKVDAWVKAGAALALKGGVGAFQMTIRAESRARGKGLARHFTWIVPTCL